MVVVRLLLCCWRSPPEVARHARNSNVSSTLTLRMMSHSHVTLFDVQLQRTLYQQTRPYPLFCAFLGS